MVTISVAVVGIIALALIYYLASSLLDLFRFRRALSQSGDLKKILSVYRLEREFDRLRNEPGIDNVDIAKKLLESINNKSSTYVSSYIYKSSLPDGKQMDVEEYIRKELIDARQRTLPRNELVMYLVTLVFCFIVFSVVGGPARTMFEPFIAK